MPRRKVAIIGTGFSASSHVDALSRLRDVEIAAIAGRSLEQAQAAARRYGIPRAYGDYRELLRDPEVEAVHNCTPNHLHTEVNLAVLAAGKHLLSEKPLAMASQESAVLAAAAEKAAQAGIVTAVCFNYRHYPLVRQIKAMLASGEHGKVHFVHGSYLQDWLLHDTDWNWRLVNEKNGASRAIADIGSHWSDLVQYILGDQIVEVFAELTTLHPVRHRPAGEVQTFGAGGAAERHSVDIDTEDFGTVLVRFAGGARGVFSVSQVSAGRKNRLSFEIAAARATFAWDQEEPNRVWVGRRDQPNAELVRDPSLLLPAAAKLAHFPGGHQEGWPDGLRNLFADFYAAIGARQSGAAYEPSFATFADGHRMMQLIEAILASNRAGRWVRVGATQEVRG